MKIRDGGPVFPTLSESYPVPVGGESVWFRSCRAAGFACAGMSLRDWFAGQALSLAGEGGITGITHRVPAGTITPQFIAAVAYAIADAMLAEREKGKCDDPR